MTDKREVYEAPEAEIIYLQTKEDIVNNSGNDPSIDDPFGDDW